MLRGLAILKILSKSEIPTLLSINQDRLTHALNVVNDNILNNRWDLDDYYSGLISYDEVEKAIAKAIPNINILRNFDSLDACNKYLRQDLFLHIDREYTELEDFILEDFEEAMEYYEDNDDDDRYETCEDMYYTIQSICDTTLQPAFYKYIIRFFIDIVESFHPEWINKVTIIENTDCQTK